MKKIIYASLFGIITLLSSCQTEGCTDPDAIHYDSKADNDDGTCVYEGTRTYWYGEDVAQFLVNNNVTTLTFYINGNIVGSCAASIYRLAPPSNCTDDAGAVTVTFDLGGNTTQAQSVEIKAQDGTTIWTTVTNFNANTCGITELTN